MSTIIRQIALLSWVSCALALPVLPQDTLKIFTFPLINQIDVVVIAKVSSNLTSYRYQYELESLPTSKQSVWAIDMPFSILPTNVQSPKGWFAIVGGRIPAIAWGADDSSYHIHPGHVESLFSYDSQGIPGITSAYIRGWVEPPSLDFEPDSTVGGDVIEDSKRILTIGAVEPPSPLLPSVFIGTLISYKHQAADLGWIINKGIVNSLDQKLENARKQLVQGNNKAAKNTLAGC